MNFSHKTASTLLPEISDQRVTIKGLAVYYRTSGNPQNPPLILLNGWGVRLAGHILPSNQVIAEFAQRGFYVYSPEHPGFMRSETPKTPWNFKDYASYLQDFIEKTNIRNPVIVGQSFGGAIATAYAATHSLAIQALILTGAGLGKGYGRRFRYLKPFLLPTYLEIIMWLWLPKICKKIFIWSALGVPWNHIEKESFHARATMSAIFKQWFLPDLYARITVPTLFVWGRGDFLFPISSAKRAAAAMPYAKFISVPGGHSVLYFHPRKIVNTIIKGLSRFKKDLLHKD